MPHFGNGKRNFDRMSEKKTYFEKEYIEKQQQDASLLLKFWPYLKPWTGYILLIAVLLILRALVYVATPAVLGKLVDEALKPGLKEPLKPLSFTFLGLVILKAFLTFWLRNLGSQYVGENLLYKLRVDLFSKFQRMPMKFFDKNPVGRLVVRLTSDVENLRCFFESEIIYMLGDFLMVIAMFLVMLYKSWQLTLLVFAVVPLLVYAIILIKDKLRESYGLAKQQLAILNTALSENISGIDIVGVFGKQSERIENFKALSSSYRDISISSLIYRGLFDPVHLTCNALSNALLIGFGGYLVKNGAITVGVLVAFLGYLDGIFHPIMRLSEQLIILQNGFASAERVFGYFAREDDIDLDEGVDLKEFKDKIEFKNLTFSYDEDKTVIKDFNYTIEKGDKVAIIGRTGAGKTTLASLLKRFYDYSEGEILIDDTDLREYSLHSIRKAIGLVQQDVTIFSGTVEDNIFLDPAKKDPEKLQRIIKDAGLEQFVETLPEGLNTKIYEKGSNLSAGERQLISFARALVDDPQILILDEATSAMDSRTEEIIQQVVEKVTKDRTAIIIAHRMSTIKGCNKVLELNLQ